MSESRSDALWKALQAELVEAQETIDVQHRLMVSAEERGHAKAVGSLTPELTRLRVIARRCGAWQTKDGVWVIGKDPVYYYSTGSTPPVMLELRAEIIEPKLWRYYYSTPEAAKDGA